MLTLPFRSRSRQGCTCLWAAQMKSGVLLLYKRRLLGSAWETRHVELHADSTLAWFNGEPDGAVPDGAVPEGTVRVRDCPELLAAGQWTTLIPDMPQLPASHCVDQLLGVGTYLPRRSARRPFKVHWLLAASAEECQEWVSAICKTVPRQQSRWMLPRQGFQQGLKPQPAAPWPATRQPSSPRPWRSLALADNSARPPSPSQARDGVVDMPGGVLGCNPWQAYAGLGTGVGWFNLAGMASQQQAAVTHSSFDSTSHEQAQVHHHAETASADHHGLPTHISTDHSLGDLGFLDLANL